MSAELPKASYIQGRVDVVDLSKDGFKPNTIDINQTLSKDLLVATGVKGRLESVSDRNYWRLGSDTMGIWYSDTSFWLQSGSILFCSQTKQEIQFSSLECNATFKGRGTIIIEATGNGGFKFIPLEGKGILTTAKGGSKEILGGRMLLVLGKPTYFGDAYDIDLKLKNKLLSEIKRTWPFVKKLFKKKNLNLKNFKYFTSLEETLKDADFIQECATENYNTKTKLMKIIGDHAKSSAIISSSSSGLLPTRIYSKCKKPQRTIIGHPFNPVYLLPAVEIVPGISSGIAAIAGCLLAYKLPGLQETQFEVFGGLALLAFVYLGGITTIWGAIVGGCLMAGGLLPEFLGVHFESIDKGLINAVGAIGLIVNAKVTNGEGVALLQTDLVKNTLTALRRPPDDTANTSNDEEAVV